LILIIFSYTVSKLVRFLRHSVYVPKWSYRSGPPHVPKWSCTELVLPPAYLTDID